MLSIRNTIRDTIQLGLRQTPKADYFVNDFSSSARDHIFDNCTPDMTCCQLIDVMFSEYDSDARQLEAQCELEMFSLEKVKKEEEITKLNLD